MAKEKADANTDNVICKQTGGKRLALEMELPNSSEPVICKVCGHKNPNNTGMCEMCSNYLFD